MATGSFSSWGRYPKARHSVQTPQWTSDVDLNSGAPLLVCGQGRSYGDSCLNDGGTLVTTRRLNHFLQFNRESGVVRVEAGVTLAELIEVCLPAGWFLPVTPGTKFVSVGGAIANDIHGKNHHGAGTFGRHVLRLELERSNGARCVCSPTENAQFFAATVGGLGLTGFIVWAEIQMKRVVSPLIDMESIKFRSLDEFFEISASSSQQYEYTVAWLDCVSSGQSFGRGIFMRGNHAEILGSQKSRYRTDPRVSVPVDFPGWALNPLTVKAFNTLYYGKQREKTVHAIVPYDPFFYPLDAVGEWNRIYGREGFFQFQCVVPSSGDHRALKLILHTIVRAGAASFLAVLKEFGSLPSPGMLSFPRPGVTLCLDFAHRGEETIRLLRCLDGIVKDCGGAIYPAKDAVMSPESFRAYYPRLEEFVAYRDPAFSSSFWRRVGGDAITAKAPFTEQKRKYA